MKDKIIEEIKVSGDFVKDYVVKFGIIKADKIKNKIDSSVSLQKKINEFRNRNIKLKGDDFFQFIINDATYFFAKRETIAFASLMVLNKWNNELNLNSEIYDDFEIEIVILRIFHLCFKELRI